MSQITVHLGDYADAEIHVEPIDNENIAVYATGLDVETPETKRVDLPTMSPSEALSLAAVLTAQARAVAGDYL